MRRFGGLPKLEGHIEDKARAKAKAKSVTSDRSDRNARIASGHMEYADAERGNQQSHCLECKEISCNKKSCNNKLCKKQILQETARVVREASNRQGLFFLKLQSRKMSRSPSSSLCACISL